MVPKLLLPPLVPPFPPSNHLIFSITINHLINIGIRVNTLCPGTIETPISATERKEQKLTFEEWEKLKTADVIMSRVGTGVEVANGALYLLSEESSYCTGLHTLPIHISITSSPPMFTCIGISLMIDGGQTACTVMKRE